MNKHEQQVQSIQLLMMIWLNYINLMAGFPFNDHHYDDLDFRCVCVWTVYDDNDDDDSRKNLFLKTNENNNKNSMTVIVKINLFFVVVVDVFFFFIQIVEVKVHGEILSKFSGIFSSFLRAIKIRFYHQSSFQKRKILTDVSFYFDSVWINTYRFHIGFFVYQ